MTTPLHRLYQSVARRCLGTITDFRTREPVVALTFDDGPDGQTTPRVLDVLDAHGARATFFVVGKAAADHPRLLRRMSEAGHAIGNHTWNHASMVSLGRRERRWQITACARAAAPYGCRLFRPPWGAQTVAGRFDAFLLGYQVIGWSVDGGDWWNPDPTALADHLISRIRPGSIVLLHDTIRSAPSPAGAPAVNYDRSAMLEALEIVLSRLSGSFRFTTVPEMFRHGKPARREWFRPAVKPLPVVSV